MEEEGWEVGMVIRLVMKRGKEKLKNEKKRKGRE
jgi:hypothetical protein